MRYTQAEKMEIIRLVEASALPVKKSLQELDISRSTFYNWYRRYHKDGYDGLADQKPPPRKFWNKIPENIKEQVVDIALEHSGKSPRELAWHITDTQDYFISESSVYRILKSYDLITSPAYIVISANNLRPADVYFNRSKEILTQRQIAKMETMRIRRYQNLGKRINNTVLDYEKCLS